MMHSNSQGYRDHIGSCVLHHADMASEQYSPQFRKLLLNAAVASECCYEKDPMDYIKRQSAPHSLDFAQCAQKPRADPPVALPWAICCSTTEIEVDGQEMKQTDGPPLPPEIVRTWFVSFRGTDNIGDILIDVAALPVPTSGYARGSVHLGFQQRANSFTPDLLRPWLSEGSNDRVVLVGHSLGGATAVLVLLNVLSTNSINTKRLIANGRLRCITFGAPLVGDAMFAGDIRHLVRGDTASLETQPLIHIVNEDDIVPKLICMLSNALLSLNPATASVEKESLQSGLTAMGSFLLKALVPGTVDWNLIANGLQAAMKVAKKTTTIYFRERLFVASGAVVSMCRHEGEALMRWCDPNEVGLLLFPREDLDMARLQFLVQSHGLQTNYIYHLYSHEDSQTSLTYRPDSLCVAGVRGQVSRSGRILTINLSGHNVIWLQDAATPVIAEKCLAVLPSSEPLQDSEVQHVQLSVELSSAELGQLMTSTETVHVNFFGYFGHIAWQDGSSSWREVLAHDDIVMTEEEEHTLEDGRFADTQPIFLLDTAILRASLICRALASNPSRQAALRSRCAANVEEMLEALDDGASDAAMVEWVKTTIKCIKGVATQARTRLFDELPSVANDLIFPGGDPYRHLDTREAKIAVLKATTIASQVLPLIREEIGASTNEYDDRFDRFGRSFSRIPEVANCSDSNIAAALTAETDDSPELNALSHNIKQYYFGPLSLRENSYYANVSPIVEAAFQESLLTSTDATAVLPRSTVTLRALCRLPFNQMISFQSLYHVVVFFAFLPAFVLVLGEALVKLPFLVANRESERKRFIHSVIKESDNDVDQFRLNMVRRAVTGNRTHNPYASTLHILNFVLEINSKLHMQIHTTIPHWKALAFLLQYIPNKGIPDGGNVGNMYTLECKLDQRLRALGCTSFEHYYPTHRAWCKTISEDFDNNSFFDLVRASSLVHRLRLHMASTYVVVVVGPRANGKGATVRNLFGCDTMSGCGFGDSSKDIRSFYIPVSEGGGGIKHLLVLDMPGSDDGAAHSSLDLEDGYALADLLVVVGKQDRSSINEKVSVIKGILRSGVAVEPAVPNKRKLCSWDPSSAQEVPVKNRDADAQTKRALCKVVYVMTHADELLSKQAERKRSYTEESVSAKARKWALDNANRARDEINQGLVDAGYAASKLSDRIAYVSCSMVSRHQQRNHLNVTAAAMSSFCPLSNAPAMCDVDAVKSFLISEKIVPPEVGETLRSIQPAHHAESESDSDSDSA